MPRYHDVFFVHPKLPAELAGLTELAHNLQWTWEQECIRLFRRLDRDLWEETNHNPALLLGRVRQEKLLEAAHDDGFVAELQRAVENLREYMAAPTWFSRSHGAVDSPKIAYFSMEYGLTECLPIYSGGLGVLSGDHMKSASDLGLPLVGVGLLYQQGYFRQYLNADGWQQETYPDNDFHNLPIRMELEKDGNPALIPLRFPGRTVYCRIWKVQVGRVALYLLDTNTPENQPRDRKITDQLYGGDRETRIQQEIVLGFGGMLALRKLGIHVHVCHMNEGHAAFMALERIRHRMATDGLTVQQAQEVVQAGTLFTTHTPVAAGIDVFDVPLVEKYFSDFCVRSGIDMSTLLSWGRRNPDDAQEPLNMAYLALRMTSKANGVSRLHGETSRRLWRFQWPAANLDEVPIEHITNGIHTRSWVSGEMSELLVRYLGPEWTRNPADANVWGEVRRIPDLELWRVHERRKDRLVAFTRERLARQLRRRNASASEVATAFETLNSRALTIGFSRRFATYKRALLLFRDSERLRKLVTDPARPVQFIFAGKAHPQDNAGKELIKQLVHFAREEGLRKHIVFVENYDMAVARYIVQGVDVWLNNPQRPLEASGTSGMKVVANGGLNLSILDGWWAEAFERGVGWAIGAGEEYIDGEYRDEIEGKALFDLLETEVVPRFYEVSTDGLPRAWIAMVKNSMARLGPYFNTHRMVQEYANRAYMPAYHAWKRLSAEKFERTRRLADWKQRVRTHWSEVEILAAGHDRRDSAVGDELQIEAFIQLGSLGPEDVRVQVYAGPVDATGEIVDGTLVPMDPIEAVGNGNHKYVGKIVCRESGRFGYLVRVMPDNEEARGPFGLSLIRWIGEKTIR